MTTLQLFLYTTEEQFMSILQSGKLNLSRALHTNDVTEGVKQGESHRIEEVNDYGYICLSKTCNSPSMWGYYADGSKGMCLVFDFDGEENTNDGYLRVSPSKRISDCFHIKEVQYENDRAPASDIDDLLFRKSNEWSYEQEFRIKMKLSDATPVILGDKVIFQTNIIMPYLKAVILGTNCLKSKQDIEAIITLNEKIKDIEVVKSKMNNTSFKIDVDIPRFGDKEKTAQMPIHNGLARGSEIFNL